MDPFDGLTDDDLLDWLAPALAGVTHDLASADQGPDFLLHALESQLSSVGEPFVIDEPLAHETLVEAQDNSEHRTDNVPTQTQPARKPRRKRGPTTQQQVQALEKLLAAHTLEAQELSSRNLWLKERVRMLEVVIAVKDVQGVRIKEVQAGLTFNPFATCIGATPEELAQASPAWVAAKFLELTGVMALRLAPLLPHLQRHPHLLWGPDPHTRWPDSPTRLPQNAPPVLELWRTTGPQLPCSCLPASTAQPLCGQLERHQQQQQGLGVVVGPPSGAKVHGSPDASVIQELHDLVDMVAGLQRSHQYIFWIQPKMLLASSVHAHAIEPALHTQWDNLLNSVHTEGTAGCTAPPTAPESHWKMVAGSMMLCDLQKLQAAVLWDLISKAIASVAAQRAALGCAMAKLRGLAQQDQAPHVAPNRSACAAETANQHYGHGQPSTAASVTNASVMQQEEAIMKKLQLTLVKQGCLVVLGAETCFASLLTPVQLAMAMVSCYPYIPDDMAMLHAAAEQFNPNVLARLQQATPAR